MHSTKLHPKSITCWHDDPYNFHKQIHCTAHKNITHRQHIYRYLYSKTLSWEAINKCVLLPLNCFGKISPLAKKRYESASRSMADFCKSKPQVRTPSATEPCVCWKPVCSCKYRYTTLNTVTCITWSKIQSLVFQTKFFKTLCFSLVLKKISVVLQDLKRGITFFFLFN